MSFYDLAERAYALGPDAIRLNIGDTLLPSPPEAVEAAVRSLGARKASYVSAAGLASLRGAIARREGCGVENVVVGPGSKSLLFALTSVLCKPGDKVAVPLPAWPAYELISRQLGLEFVGLPSRLEQGWSFDPAGVDGARLVILCNPANPTSIVYPPALVEATLARARAAGAEVVLDEAYRGLAFEPMPVPDAVRVRSFSKEFSLEGWRLGYLVAPAPLAARVVAFNQITATCVAPFVQEAGEACLANEERILDAARALWSERARVACEAMGEAGFRFARPQAGLYLFAAHERIADGYGFAERLLEQEVAVAPGSAFGPYPDFVRICLNQPEPLLREAVRRMRAVLGEQGGA